MAPNGPWLTIIGIGEDGRAGLSLTALAALDRAEFVIGGARHLDLAAPLSAETQTWPSPFAEGYPWIVARRGRPTCVLATGDPFHYGVGAELARLVPLEEITCLPQSSAFSLAAARLGWSLPDCDCVSLHGRALERVVPHLQPGARILALSWDGSTPGKLAKLLRTRGFGASTITVCEAMGGPRERIRRALAADFAIAEIDPLNTIAIEFVAASDAKVVTLAPGLPDSFFENDGQLTKAEIRALTLSARAPRAGALLGDGACAIRATAASGLRNAMSAPRARAAMRLNSAQRRWTSALDAHLGRSTICPHRMPSSSAVEPRSPASSTPPGPR